MRKIILVCSGHRENGLCNIRELLGSFEAIQPQVIFEEIRASDFDSYYKHGSKVILETQAISKYTERKKAQQIPVDSYDIPEYLFEETQRVFDYVEQTSHEYLELTEENNQYVFRCGFRYLNSDRCVRMNAKISESIKNAIVRTDDQGLIRGFVRWSHFIKNREIEMVENIYSYCENNVFDTGVFLIGAAHRESIVKEIELRATSQAELIDWNYSNYEKIL